MSFQGALCQWLEEGLPEKSKKLEIKQKFVGGRNSQASKFTI